MIAFSGRMDILVQALEAVLLLACMMWVMASLARAGRHILAVQRRRAALTRRHGNLQRDIDTARHSVRQQESALHKLEQAFTAKQLEVEEALARLDALRRDGLREYQVLTERFGEKDKLWLLSVPRTDKPARWAVAAPDPHTATAILTKKIADPEKPAVEGQL